jgi:hypothetical protein
MRQAWACRPGELAGLCAHKRHEVLERIHFQGFRSRNAEWIVGDRHDRHEIATRIVWQLVMKQWIDGDHSGEREQQHVIVARGEKPGHCRNSVAPLTIFYDNRLTPALGQALCKQARGHVRRAAGRERYDQVHRFLRPRLGL